MLNRMKIYLAVKRVLAENPGYTRTDAYRAVAERMGYEVDSVRRRYNQVKEKDFDRHVNVLEMLTEVRSNEPVALGKMREIVRESNDRIEAHKLRLETDGTLQNAVFMSDIHFPKYHRGALNLAYKIIDDVQPTYISALNDALDFPEISKWGDRRRISEASFASDVSNTVDLYTEHERNLTAIAPNALKVSIAGNHDIRPFLYTQNAVSDTLSAGFMSQMYYEGNVLFPSLMEYENVFSINKKLHWFHGNKAAKRSSTNAKNTLELVARTANSDYFVDVVVGHTHRPATERTPWGTFYNSGCLCDLQPSYLRYDPGWTHGITVSQFDPNGRWHNTQVVLFERVKDKLIAVYNGKRYVEEY